MAIIDCRPDSSPIYGLQNTILCVLLFYVGIIQYNCTVLVPTLALEDIYKNLIALSIKEASSGSFLHSPLYFSWSWVSCCCQPHWFSCCCWSSTRDMLLKICVAAQTRKETQLHSLLEFFLDVSLTVSGNRNCCCGCRCCCCFYSLCICNVVTVAFNLILREVTSSMACETETEELCRC